MCWFECPVRTFGVNVFWTFEVNVLWTFGVNVLWTFGVNVLWTFGVNVLWTFGVNVLWTFGVNVLWTFGVNILWTFGVNVLWTFGCLFRNALTLFRKIKSAFWCFYVLLKCSFIWCTFDSVFLVCRFYGLRGTFVRFGLLLFWLFFLSHPWCE